MADDVLKVLDKIETKPEVIILDPPREGTHPKALSRILNYGVENIIYIVQADKPFAGSCGYERGRV